MTTVSQILNCLQQEGYTVNLNLQSQIRYAVDYYELIAWLLVGTLLLVGLLPYFNRTVVYLKSPRLVPA